MEQKACHLQCNRIQSLPYRTFSHCAIYTLSLWKHSLSQTLKLCHQPSFYAHFLKKLFKKVVLQWFLETNVEKS